MKQRAAFSHTADFPYTNYVPHRLTSPNVGHSELPKPSIPHSWATTASRFPSNSYDGDTDDVSGVHVVGTRLHVVGTR